MKAVHLLVSALAALLALAPAAWGITRDQAVKYALEHSDELAASRHESEALSAQGRQAASIAWPHVSTQAGYNELDTNAPAFPNPLLNPWFFPERDISAKVQASQVLFAGFRVLNSLKLKSSLYEQATLSYDASRRGVVRRVKDAFDSVLLARASLEVLRDRAEQAQAEFQDAKDLYDAGMVTSLDVRQARLALNTTQMAVREAQAALDTAITGFNQLIGRPPGEEPLVPEGDLSETPEVELLVDALFSSLESWNFPDVDLARTREKSALYQKKVAGGRLFPEVAAVGTAETSGQEFDEMYESWTAGINLKWDIFDGGLIWAQRAEAAARHKRASAGVSAAKKEIVAAVRRIRANLDGVNARIGLAEETVKLSEQNYQDARGHYRAGTITITRLGEFSVAWAQARFSLLSLYREKRALAAEAAYLLGSARSL
ncbi:MAG: TolC family protein [Deltaproteobacteria bacterium]|nr:TolC family protein [Deltaproteobacteria bacterium]